MVRPGSRVVWTWFVSGMVGIWGLALMAGAGGCAGQNKPAGTPIEQAWEQPAAPARLPVSAVLPPEPVVPQPATAPAGGEVRETAEAVVAVVNGKPIGWERLTRMLVESHGLTLLEQMILLTAVQQKAAEMGLKVTPADVKAANEEALRRISTPIGGEGAPLDRVAAERLLAEFLVAKNISQGEWEVRMEQRACLTKIAAAEVEKMTVTQDMLKGEYALAYGERVQIRHIQVPSLAEVERVRAALAAGKDFPTVAREMSDNQITATNGGLMPPFTRNDGAVPPLIRETAFSMQPGDVSPAVQVDNWYHIIKLERRFPASGVTFENADRDALKKRLVDRLTRQREEVLEQELFRSARVDIRDEVLRKQFRGKYHK